MAQSWKHSLSLKIIRPQKLVNRWSLPAKKIKNINEVLFLIMEKYCIGQSILEDQDEISKGVLLKKVSLILIS